MVPTKIRISEGVRHTKFANESARDFSLKPLKLFKNMIKISPDIFEGLQENFQVATENHIGNPINFSVIFQRIFKYRIDPRCTEVQFSKEAVRNLILQHLAAICSCKNHLGHQMDTNYTNISTKIWVFSC